MDDQIKAFIKQRYEAAKRTQTQKNKVEFQITLEQFTEMWKVVPNQLKLVKKNLDAGTIKQLLDSKHGYVCSWINKADLIAGNPMTHLNAKIQPRSQAKKVFWLKKGETHSEEAKEKIRQYRLGQEHSEETKEKQRIANLGTVDSEETKIKKSVAAKARWARIKGELK